MVYDTRQEPYEDCDDAIEAIFAEFTDDVEFQRKRAIKLALDRYSETRVTLDQTEHLIDRLEAANSLSDLRRVINRHVADTELIQLAVMPIRLISDRVRVVRNVEFVHFTSKSGATSIMERGFKGRMTPHRQTLTRMVPDFTLEGDGYIFAYPHDEVGSVRNNYKIVGEASQAISFYFHPDHERQLIIPVKCIEYYDEESI